MNEAQALEGVLISNSKQTGLLASHLVTCHEVDLPVKSKSQAMTLAPFALEDQLDQDVELLHFTLKRHHKKWLVWVCDQAVLSKALEGHTEALKKLVPDYFALPYSGNGPTYLIDGGRVIVRLDQYKGFAIDEAHFDQALALLGLMRGDCQQVNQSLATLMERMPSPSLSLLQGQFGQHLPIKNWLMSWTGVAASVLVILGLYLVQLNSDNQTINEQIKAQKQANVALFKQLFPEETRIVNIRAQAQQKVARLAKIKEQQKSNMIALLDQIMPLLKAQSSMKVNLIQYNNYALELELEAQSLAQAEQFNNQLKDLKLLAVDVKQLSSVDRGKAVTSVVIKRAL